MRKLFDWFTLPLTQPDLGPDELAAAKRRLEYLTWKAKLLGVSVANHEDDDGK